MAGRHGVPQAERRTHARSAAGARRQRVQSRDAAQPWTAWLLLRAFLALLVLAAATWSVLLLRQSRGGIWPYIALAAGALSLVMIVLDVLARRRQRARWRAEAVARLEAAVPVPPVGDPVPTTATATATSAAPPPAPVTEPQLGGYVPDIVPTRRRSHRR
jgi:hypothetical protein